MRNYKEWPETKKTWTYRSAECYIVEFQFGGRPYFCGYARVKGPSLDTEFTDAISVHGGVTWTDHDEYYTECGFDCNHLTDPDTPKTRSLPFVMSQVKSMVRQMQVLVGAQKKINTIRKLTLKALDECH